MTKNGSQNGSVSKREKEVLRCLVNGCSLSEVANDLGITQRTVKFHICNIIRKLEANNRTQAVVLAIKKGLID